MNKVAYEYALQLARKRVDSLNQAWRWRVQLQRGNTALALTKMAEALVQIMALLYAANRALLPTSTKGYDLLKWSRQRMRSLPRVPTDAGERIAATFSQASAAGAAAEVERLARESLTVALALMPELGPDELQIEIDRAILDMQVAPTINLNSLYSRVAGDVLRQRALQGMLESVMQKLMAMAAAQGLSESFFLHVAPNLGRDAQGKERLKPATEGDVGSTDIQFMLRGSIKEVGLLVLINRHIADRTGTAPLGDDFNVRTAPHDHDSLIELCKQRIARDQMPHLVGVGDTVTSTPCPSGEGWLRGGSDRGFLTLLQELGATFGRSNRVVLVDSSGGEVDRPSLSDGTLAGISDPDDTLQFDVCMPGGPDQYVAWFMDMARARSLAGLGR